MPRGIDDEQLDVDARFLLANERTLLAWVRTALALVVSGAGIEEFGEQVPGRTVLAVLLVALGVAAATLGATRCATADRAIRRGELPPGVGAPAVVALLVALAGGAVLLAILAG